MRGLAAELQAPARQPGESPAQLTLNSVAAAPTVAPLNNAALSAWILANCSAGVKRLVNDAQFQLNITWDNAIPGAVASTDIRLIYTDAVGTAGNMSLFGALPGIQATIAGLSYPLANYTLQIPLSVNATASADAASPAAIGRQTLWRTNLAHELESHTKLAIKMDEHLARMAVAAKNIPEAKRRIADSLNIRSDDAEHANLASGGGGISATFERVVLNAPAAQQASLVIDAATDRRDHMNHIPLAIDQKLALRSVLKWVKDVVPKLAPLSGPDSARIDALKALLGQDIAAL